MFLLYFSRLQQKYKQIIEDIKLGKNLRNKKKEQRRMMLQINRQIPKRMLQANHQTPRKMRERNQSRKQRRMKQQRKFKQDSGDTKHDRILRNKRRTNR